MRIGGDKPWSDTSSPNVTPSRSAGQYHTAQDFVVRSLHIYVAIFERNHICVAESLENLAVCRFAPTANEYNQQLRKVSMLKLDLDSKATRVARCEARAELRREALVKLKKTPGLILFAAAANHV